MFLHLGENVMIRTKDIVMIFNIETSSYSCDTTNFLKLAEEDGFVEKIGNEKLKSCIVAEISRKSKIFLSPISSVTLLKRI